MRTKSDPFYSALAKTTEAEEKIIDRVYELAEKKGCTVPQIALAWQYTKKYVTAPIVGVSKKAHLDDLIGALKIKLSPDEVKFLEEPYQPKRIQGHM